MGTVRERELRDGNDTKNALLLEHEMKRLQAANTHPKRKRNITRIFIVAGGILTGVDGQ